MQHPIPDPAAMNDALAAALDDARADAGQAGRTFQREDAVGAVRRHIGRQQGLVRRAFEAREIKGVEAGRLLAALIDGVIATLGSLARDATATNADSGPADAADALCIAATGGYGAGLLAPFSDIDLLFLSGEQPSPRVLARVEYVLYFLWDLGLRVGHATRSISQCLTLAGEDATIRTALLDARRLWGEPELFASFSARFAAACSGSAASIFVADKIAEHRARHQRFGDSPFLVEPNVKEGRGALRDLQTLNWIGRVLIGVQPGIDLFAASRDGSDAFARAGLLTDHEIQRARRAWTFLWTVRFHLHYIAGRADERLNFDVQPVIGARMGYAWHGRQAGVERFMRHYFLTVREVTRLGLILEPAILASQPHGVSGPRPSKAISDEITRAGLQLLDGKLAPLPEPGFAAEPLRMLSLLDIARRHVLPLHPLATQALIRNERAAGSLPDDPRARALFLDLLCARPTTTTRCGGAPWLHVLNDTGILGRMLPDWSKIVGQMQFDTYHIYTVDEHTIEAVRILFCIESGTMADEITLAYDIAREIDSRRALYVAVLLHDIAKGRGGDHSELGSEVATEVCPGLGLDSEETDTVSWLVLHHLLLSQTAFRRDIDDPRTILDLADTIQSPERLRLLLLLTIADMRAVSPKVWNAWKATLLRELYTRVAEVLEGGMAAQERDGRVAQAKELARDALTINAGPGQGALEESEIERYLSLGYAGYWLSFDTDTHARHARMIAQSDRDMAPLTVEALPIPARDVTEVTILTADHPGLFSQIAGALAVAGASIVDARIHTLSDGMALDTFWIQDHAGHAFEAPHQLVRLNSLVEQALSGRLNLDREIARIAIPAIRRRARAIHVPPRVLIDNRASDRHTVLEINGRDRPGLLHDVTRVISEQSLQIASAHITTYGMRAVDVFYVRDLLGMKLTGERRVNEVRAALVAALERAEDANADPALLT
ncbi:PII uridylyl-transferase [Tanticharoenia sakaeratensis NBRC 103193]|uniref:Bifunctional uridylyltransferase/uridylyl-removing enzyme n=2 Tax=Tanticharoenia TaxID=444052 RepID=A0A0D6MKD2_9PROT|nr:[protein-PII] uridylyltransferase [Tanticharoenia sakaeratensis]GAN53931.1 PII uridylyl-transferase [Tanticharoenia sakaeratensis NBRC 103193]